MSIPGSTGPKPTKEIPMKILALAAALMLASPALADQFYNADGSYAGQAFQTGGSTQFFNANGTYAGQAVQTGGSTQFFNADGSYAGQAFR